MRAACAAKPRGLMRNSAGPDDAPDAAPDQHVRPRHVAPLRTANDRTARLGLERPRRWPNFTSGPPRHRLHETRMLAARGADVSLALEVRVQLGSEEQREGR